MGTAILIVTTNISTKYCTREFSKMGLCLITLGIWEAYVKHNSVQTLNPRPYLNTHPEALNLKPWTLHLKHQIPKHSALSPEPQTLDLTP